MVQSIPKNFRRWKLAEGHYADVVGARRVVGPGSAPLTVRQSPASRRHNPVQFRCRPTIQNEAGIVRPVRVVAGGSLGVPTAGERKAVRRAYRQKSLNRVGLNSVYRTVCWIFLWPR